MRRTFSEYPAHAANWSLIHFFPRAVNPRQIANRHSRPRRRLRLGRVRRSDRVFAAGNPWTRFSRAYGVERRDGRYFGRWYRSRRSCGVRAAYGGGRWGHTNSVGGQHGAAGGYHGVMAHRRLLGDDRVDGKRIRRSDRRSRRNARIEWTNPRARTSRRLVFVVCILMGKRPKNIGRIVKPSPRSLLNIVRSRRRCDNPCQSNGRYQ